MPKRVKMRRYEAPNDLRFLTFSTYQRLPLFGNERIRDRFAEHLAAARERFGFHLYGWVLMPEHVHLLLWPRLPHAPVSSILRELKRGIATEAIQRWDRMGAAVLERLTTDSGVRRFWQRGGGYDRNIHSDEERREKIEYMHWNPVKRGLVNRPEDWPWSSARWYAGDRSSVVQIAPMPPRRPE